jgi:hypothetical protein
MERNVIYGGHGVLVPGVPEATSCMVACQLDDACLFFTHHSSTAGCELKKDYTGRHESMPSNWISGPKYPSLRVNGGWTEWSGEGCSSLTTCRGRNEYMTRTCTRPTPAGGGKSCENSCESRMCRERMATDLLEDCDTEHRVEQEMRDHLANNLGSNQDLANSLKCFLDRKYDDRKWFVMVYDDVGGWQNNALDGFFTVLCVNGKSAGAASFSPDRKALSPSERGAVQDMVPAVSDIIYHVCADCSYYYGKVKGNGDREAITDAKEVMDRARQRFPTFSMAVVIWRANVAPRTRWTTCSWWRCPTRAPWSGSSVTPSSCSSR